jgi:hypothetical protein
MKRLFYLVMALLCVVCSCNPNQESPSTGMKVGKGVFVLNEGTYMYANASLSFYDPMADTSSNNLFYLVNGSPIGDVGQSLAMINKDLYIVVNNSNYIYKVNAETMVCDTMHPYLLTDFYSPRYMLPLSAEKAYVSDLSGLNLWVINPKEMTHTGSIVMDKPTETMVQVGQEVYVTNWSRYYHPEIQNNTVQVVDAVNDVKVAEIVVGYEPNGMVVDKDGFVWVMCEGDVNDFDMPSTLWRIDPMTKQATLVRTFPKKALNLAIDPSGTVLYYLHGEDVYRASIYAADHDDASFCIASDGRTFYKISVNPYDGDLYVSDAKNYMVSGTVYRYSSDGLLLSSFNAGICPGYFLFN